MSGTGSHSSLHSEFEFVNYKQQDTDRGNFSSHLTGSLEMVVPRLALRFDDLLSSSFPSANLGGLVMSPFYGYVSCSSYNHQVRFC